MKAILSSLLCAVSLIALAPAGMAEALKVHKVPVPTPIAKELRAKEDMAHMMAHGIFACKGQPVLVCALFDGYDGKQDVYFVPGKENGSWGKARLALKDAPLGDHGPAVACSPQNQNTLVFYHVNPTEMEEAEGDSRTSRRKRGRHADEDDDSGEGGEYVISYYVTTGKGLKVAPKVREVTKSFNGRSGTPFLVAPRGVHLAATFLHRGKHKGRVVAMVGLEDDKACALYSDNMGKTWKVGTPLPEGAYANRWVGEGRLSTTGDGYPVFEAENGELLIYVNNEPLTWLVSADGGESWKVKTLSREECQRRYRANPKTVPCDGVYDVVILNAGDGEGNNSRVLGIAVRGETLELYLSYDWGATWSHHKSIDSVRALGAMSVCQLRPGVIGMLMTSVEEMDEAQRGLSYATVTLSWLTDGADDGTSLPGAGAEETGDDSPEP